MFINITASETGNNKGSSGALVNYLEKENQLQSEKGKGLSPEYWFNGSDLEIRRQEVRMKIDSNIAKLGQDDAKFFLINISPSQKELAHLFAKYGEEGAKEKLKEFSVKVMDEYARNFKRPGISSHKDLLWYGKLENYRYYSHTDKEVKNSTKQKGDRKEGRQMHIQIIVSRKDISNKIKLSPQNTSKGKNKEHSAKLGQFDRTAFKQSGESLFDRHFEFNRGLKDTLTYANTMKNGTAMQKTQMQMIADLPKYNSIPNNIIMNIGTQVAGGAFEGMGQMLDTVGKVSASLLEILLTPEPNIAPDINPMEEAEKRRIRRMNRQQSQGLQR